LPRSGRDRKVRCSSGLAALKLCAGAALRYKVDPQLFAYASAIIAAVQYFFLLLINFAANPFGWSAERFPPTATA
jgi:cytochrome c biogenesis factor